MNDLLIQENIFAMHPDAVLWKAQKLWGKELDPDEQAAAMDELVDLIC